jgi:hypothetical protein
MVVFQLIRQCTRSVLEVVGSERATSHSRRNCLTLWFDGTESAEGMGRHLLL